MTAILFFHALHVPMFLCFLVSFSPLVHFLYILWIVAYPNNKNHLGIEEFLPVAKSAVAVFLNQHSVTNLTQTMEILPPKLSCSSWRSGRRRWSRGVRSSFASPLWIMFESPFLYENSVIKTSLLPLLKCAYLFLNLTYGVVNYY
ncbi:uncharacterized protein LOC130746278 isoform X2 [Lotus japonicus]|uniref:uncharacterized protein LOC130746278 isoform X2 n=1 Tax=Lotus japonicus TaxID=34305 RepID=UPI002585D733|nr:uncharacterized protein LOC130746278 isoform X2 [Lotus japonicus]